jgi:starch synthase
MNLSEKTLHVLFIAAEADPFVKVGGLGDVAGSLPLALKHCYTSQLDIRLAIPYYASIHKTDLDTKLVANFKIQTVEEDLEVSVFETHLDDLPVYLIDGKPISESNSVYGNNFELDADKFIFFSLACLYLPLNLNWQIDILHANDWHTAVAIYQLALERKQNSQLSRTKSILSLHNLPFMGTGAEKALQKYRILPAKNPRMPAWARKLPLPMGLNTADKIVAVSPSYANEILTPEYGCDLQNFLQSKKKNLSGILNGIDYTSWNPQNDHCLLENYSINSLENRNKNKLNLQHEFDLSSSSEIPLLIFIGRLDQQKGVDFVIAALKNKWFRNQEWQVIFLGTGDKLLEAKIVSLEEQFPDHIRSALRFDGPLSHRLYAGADMLLMPSRYEPCGLAQMIAMRYGCVPIARATGGLIDTIHDYSTGVDSATGFLWQNQKDVEFAHLLISAIRVFSKHPSDWLKLQQNGMRMNNSWQNSAARYFDLYNKLIKAK